MNFSQLISDGDGAPSTMRVATLFVVLAVVGTWAVISIRTNTFAPMNSEMVALVVGTLTAKAVQSHAENKAPANP